MEFTPSAESAAAPSDSEVRKCRQTTPPIIVAALASVCLAVFLHVLLLRPGPVAIAVSLACIIALLGSQLLLIGEVRAGSGRYRPYVVLAAQAGLAYLPLVQFGQAWAGMPGFLAGSVLLVLSPRAAWPAFAGIVAGVGVIRAVLTGHPLEAVYAAVLALATGLVVFGLTRLQSVVDSLRAVQGVRARLAVADERVRFARDLHDLLGYSLSAIALKSEIAHRLVLHRPEDARAELNDSMEICRRAMTDIRSVACKVWELSLDEECRSARSLLTTAGIDTRLQVDHGDLPKPVDSLAATVLRESVTNILRHSKAQECDIAVVCDDGQVSVVIRNDGVDGHHRGGGAHGGNGLRNLSHRVGELGGTLQTELIGTTHRLTVSIPLTVLECPDQAASEDR